MASLWHEPGWYAVFAIAVGLNAVAALLALFLLKPVRGRFIASTEPRPAREGLALSPVRAAT